MYRSEYDSQAETRFVKRSVLWVMLLLFVASGAGWLFTRAAQTVDTGILRYEEFQEIYNTCKKLDTDLGVIRAVPDDDRMFASFSKAAMVAQKQQQMSRWVEEYNAKSRMWNRALWKSSDLPYEISVNQFANFRGN